MLSQLSYAPEASSAAALKLRTLRLERCGWVGLPRLERGTSVLSGLRSSQLSYRPTGSSAALACDNWRVRNSEDAAQTASAPEKRCAEGYPTAPGGCVSTWEMVGRGAETNLGVTTDMYP